MINPNPRWELYHLQVPWKTLAFGPRICSGLNSCVPAPGSCRGDPVCTALGWCFAGDSVMSAQVLGKGKEAVFGATEDISVNSATTPPAPRNSGKNSSCVHVDVHVQRVYNVSSERVGAKW